MSTESVPNYSGTNRDGLVVLVKARCSQETPLPYGRGYVQQRESQAAKALGSGGFGVRLSRTITVFGASVLWCAIAAYGGDRGPLPRRIVTIAPNAAETICELGACDRIVGVSPFSVYPAELATLPRVGGLVDPDLERIVALRPDLVVLRGRCDAVERLCRENSIPLHFDSTDTIVGIATGVTELGERLGLTREAGVVVRRFQDRIDAIIRSVAGRDRPRVLLTASRQADRMSDILTTGRGTFLDRTIALAGGENIFGDIDMSYPQVSTESIVVRRPDVIIELMPGFKLTKKAHRHILEQWRSLGPIPAVVNDRVHIITDDHCLIPSLRYVDIIEKIADLLHPERSIGKP